MAKLTIQFESENAEFADNPIGETVSILMGVIARIESERSNPDGSYIRDTNGNSIGAWSFKQ